jgi:tetraacyldisaccharide 4'-kinase
MRFLLFPLSLLYRAGCQVRNFLYDRKILKARKAALPVLSIGNISVGGSEKTPLAMALVSYFLEKGMKPALVTRGYKGKWEQSGGTLSDGKAVLGTWEDAGDEPYMAALNFPKAGIFVGKNRIISCEKAKELGFDMIILDDGFQHRRLSRDIDIVSFNPREKILLREPVSSLKRADIILIKEKNEYNAKEDIKKKFPHTKVYEYSVIPKGIFRINDRTSVTQDSLSGKKVLVFCGIAKPDRFISLLKSMELNPIQFLMFPDHHSYPASTLEKVASMFEKSKADILITTEKDSVKLLQHKPFSDLPIYFQKIEARLKDDFFNRINSLLNARAGRL